MAPSSRKTLVPTCYCGMDLIMPIMLAYEPQLLRSPLCGRLSGHRFGAPPGPGFFFRVVLGIFCGATGCHLYSIIVLIATRIIYKPNIHIRFSTSSTVFEGYSPLSGLGTARYLVHVQPVFCELSLICISASASSATSVSGSSRNLVPYNRNTGFRHSGLSRVSVGIVV